LPRCWDKISSGRASKQCSTRLQDEASGLKRVYAELSEYSHFGPLAVFNVHRITDEVERTVAWSDAPHWRDEQHLKIACAQTRELAVALQHWLNAFGATAAIDARRAM